jgi:hypothetical protein
MILFVEKGCTWFGICGIYSMGKQVAHPTGFSANESGRILCYITSSALRIVEDSIRVDEFFCHFERVEADFFEYFLFHFVY